MSRASQTSGEKLCPTTSPMRLQVTDLGRRLEARPLGHDVDAAPEQATIGRQALRGRGGAPRGPPGTRVRA